MFQPMSKFWYSRPLKNARWREKGMMISASCTFKVVGTPPKWANQMHFASGIIFAKPSFAHLLLYPAPTAGWSQGCCFSDTLGNHGNRLLSNENSFLFDLLLQPAGVLQQWSSVNHFLLASYCQGLFFLHVGVWGVLTVRCGTAVWFQ